MDPLTLPAPEVLMRRHMALAAVEDMLGLSRGGFRSFGSDPPSRFWFDSGSGDFYDLFVSGQEAVITLFDHEAPRSPWSLDEGSEDPGILEGLPRRLLGGLPEREEDEPVSVTACFWFTDGSWHEGAPEPVRPGADVYDDDPGGAASLLAPLLHPCNEVEELLRDSQPERRDEAFALMREMGVDCSGRVTVQGVGLLVRWSAGPPAPGDDRLSFELAEFADLSDGRRVLERGASSALELVPVARRRRGRGCDPVTGLTLAEVQETVREDLLGPGARSWEDLADALEDNGVSAAPRDLDRLPAVVDFAPEVRAHFHG